uniref:Uncharacterized protein n=1 Tax=Rhizophora mucronata TaxID=61149 RepID=A0A2P2IYV8_RHIMU
MALKVIKCSTAGTLKEHNPCYHLLKAYLMRLAQH